MNNAERRQESYGECKPLGELMNQGGGSRRSSADTLPELMAQGKSTKRGNPGTKKLKEYLGQ